MKFLDKLERKYKKFAIKDLMMYIVFLNMGVYVLNYILPDINIIDKLVFSVSAVSRGEIWRIITFIFVPPNESIIFIIFVLYFYYIIGMSLESVWGSFRFNVFYFAGAFGSLLAAIISGGYADAMYLNLTLFLAYAYFYPESEVYLFFILPIKIKYLALLDVFFLGVEFFKGGLNSKLLILAAFINCIIFFGKDIIQNIKREHRRFNNKQKFNVKKANVNKSYFHRCHVCGMTEKDDPNMEFRYCSECDGNYEYCMHHLNNHFHIKKGGKA